MKIDKRYKNFLIEQLKNVGFFIAQNKLGKKAYIDYRKNKKMQYKVNFDDSIFLTNNLSDIIGFLKENL